MTSIAHGVASLALGYELLSLRDVPIGFRHTLWFSCGVLMYYIM